nr:ATP-binding protein [uncultured Dyadobacter sp.]
MNHSNFSIPKLLLLFVILVPLGAVAQLSGRVYHALPDSLKPLNKNHLSPGEISAVLNYISIGGEILAEDYPQIDTLSSLIAEANLGFKTKKERIGHALLISRYWIHRCAFLGQNATWALDSAEKYQNAISKIIDNDTVTYRRGLAFSHLYKGVILALRDQHTAAYKQFQMALAFNKSVGDLLLQGQIYTAMSTLYFVLELYGPSISYLDSSYQLMKMKAPNFDQDPAFSGMRSTHVNHKAQTYGKLWENDKSKNNYLDSAIVYCQQLTNNAGYAREHRSAAFRLVSRIYYHKKDFKASLAAANSALSEISDKVETADYANIEMMKGLCLLRLGKKQEGWALIRRNEKLGATFYYETEIVHDLFKLEKDAGNLESALVYQERLLELEKSSQLNQSRGEVFEIQRKFDIATRDLSIQGLLEKEKRNKAYAAAATLAVCLIGSSLGLRVMRARKKTRTLIRQMDELTELQISRIEDEKERERKRFGQELHDELAGSIAAGVRYLRMKAEDEIEPGSKHHFREISDMLEKSYNKARGKSHELYLEEASQAFWKRLTQNIELFFVGTNMKVSVTRDTFDLILTPETKTTILLVMKEAITNVIKHSKATEVEILIYEETNRLILEISDNGAGINSLTTGKNIGLRSIRERAEKLGGELKISKNVPSGMTLNFSLPVHFAQSPS